MHLPDSATREHFDRAYQRLVKRYPPEFHPEKFRQIDEAYNFLTSLPYLLERLLTPQKLKIVVNQEEFKFFLIGYGQAHSHRFTTDFGSF